MKQKNKIMTDYKMFPDKRKTQLYYPDKEIPKIIHQTWKTKILPEKYKEYSKRWQLLHPDYEYILYDDKDLEDLVRKAFPNYLDFYINGISSNIERVDFARYVMLYSKGGIYADIDTIPIKNFDILLENYNKILLEQEPKEHRTEGRQLLCNSLMVSPINGKTMYFWRKFLEFIVDTYEPNLSPVDTTGPFALRRFANVFKNFSDYVIVNNTSCFFNSVTNRITNNNITIFDDSGRTVNLKGISSECAKCKDRNNIYAAHLWDNTWVQKSRFDDPRWKNKKYISCVLSFTLMMLFIGFVLLICWKRNVNF